MTSCLLMTIMYIGASREVFREIQSKVLSIAATAAAQIDGDDHTKLRVREDEDTDEYRRIEEQLRVIRDVNRRDDVEVAYIYTMTVPEDQPGALQFGVDPEENPEDKSHLCDFYKAEQLGSEIRIDSMNVDEDFTVDQWGRWLSANAPVRDSEGNAVASLGVDVDAADVTQRLNTILAAGVAGLAASVVLAILLSCIMAARMAKPLHNITSTVKRIGDGDLEAKIDVTSSDEFGEVASAINGMTKGLREGATLRKLFARYLSHQVADDILRTGGHGVASGERRKITIMFTDIRGFTGMSESLSPEQVVGFLNEYFEEMIGIISRHNGVLDKLLGDGMMVVFGAPEDDAYQEENAVRAALEIRRRLAELCEKWESEGHGGIRIGIGINSGYAVVGSIGSAERMEYTAVGDTVNVAAHIESATKEADADILISEFTNVAVRHEFETRSAGSVALKSRVEPVTVYEVIGQKAKRTRRKNSESGVLPAAATA